MAKFDYIPILRWKEGEKNAIRSLLPADKANMTPMFLLEPEQYKVRKATKKTAAVPSADHFVAQVAAFWGKDAFYLDASGIAAPAGTQHPVIAIAAAARAHGLKLIPATPLGAPAAYTAAVAAIVQQDQEGVALRIDLQEFTSAATWAPTWPFPLAETDLIADFGDDIGSVTKLGNIVQTVFQQLHAGKDWRTVTIAGTSMPANFAGMQQGVYTIPMETLALWQMLHPVVPYRLDYGDYATPPLGVIPPGIVWGYPINVRYTLVGQYLICKGVKTRGSGAVDAAVQLTGHAQTIVQQANRNRLTGCWADDEIDAIAAGASPQGLLHWVKIGVNQHLTLLRRTLP
ncbi:beta family protein [Methylobacterium sp. J-076]|uniref:beta family protein n=1 Tax=Methylobacterium sp. J-076 TaxID=2836655 RepID=UPI001FB979BD|nr:beta family protein [Methylobacterium sp. J-076]MCJ2011798.1 beta family protein [Methylobacterium sp. J-076]